MRTILASSIGLLLHLTVGLKVQLSTQDECVDTPNWEWGGWIGADCAYFAEHPDRCDWEMFE